MFKASHYLGINIGGTHCSISLGTHDGRILERRAWPTIESPTPQSNIARIRVEFDAMKQGDTAVAAGVAIGGPLDTASGTVLGPPNLPDWSDLPLQSHLRKALGIPVRVAHDAAACALAEAQLGSWNATTLVYLTCGTGFGAGIVQNNRILTSSNGLHPEIGHWQLSEAGPAAFGKQGSAEALCSGKGLSRIATWRFPERWTTEPNPTLISSLAAQGDQDAQCVMDLHAFYTGKVCAMIAELLCPDIIILGSLATHIGKPWVDKVRHHYHQQVLPRIGHQVRVEPNALQDRLQDLSAIMVAASLSPH